MEEKLLKIDHDSLCCPDCKAKALNRYGRISGGQQRYICIVCGRQFVVPTKRRPLPVDRPVCPNCGQAMHLYAREAGSIRFRCSGYPECKTYRRINMEESN